MSVDNVTIRQLQDSIEAHRRLLAAATQKAEAAQAQLIRIGLDFCGQQFDRLQKEGLVLEATPPETLGELVVGALKTTLMGKDQEPVNWTERLEELNRRIESLQKEVDIQTRRANLAEEKGLQLQRQALSLDQSLSHERNKKGEIPTFAPPSPSAEHYQEWMALWRMKRAFERDRQVILLMGETGHSRLGEVRQELVQKAGLGERAVYRGVEACQEEGLIERRRGASVQGRPTDLVYLTEKGKWAYEQLSGKPARSGEFEMLLKAHKSRKHTSLILKTSDHFTRLGFLVEREPLRIKISENRYFQPDLVARKDGKAFYLEVESGERAERSSLLHKWENAFIAGGGRIYVVAPRPGVMNTVQSMILNWATENGRKPSLYLTHLEALKGCQPGDSPWVRIR